MFRRAFTYSWLAYFGFYLCRKNFSVLMPYLKSEAALSSNDLAGALFGYSLFYSLGQFVMGRTADRVGARWVAGAGMVVSAAMSALLSWPAGIGVAAVVLFIQSVNGAAQSCGWPSVLRISKDYFPNSNRGVWLGLWSTHMVLGGFAGTWLAARCAEAHWTYAAWIPALLLLGIAITFLLFVPKSKERVKTKENSGHLRITPPLMAIAAMYFSVKLTRYAFLFWLPLYMTEHLGYAKPLAGYASSAFELVGLAGAIGAGYVSERMGGKRFVVGGAMMFILAFLCAMYPTVGEMGLVPNLIMIALIGAFTFGPDTLMAAAALHDLVPSNATASAGGFINGIGSIGQIVSPLAVAYLSANYGWPALFGLLAGMVLCGGAALATQWIRMPEQKQEALG